RRRRGEVEDVVDVAFDVQVVGDVVVDEPEPAVLEEVVDVAGLAGDQVVDGGDLRPRLDQGGAHVGAEEAGAAKDNDVFVGERLPTGQVLNGSSRAIRPE